MRFTADPDDPDDGDEFLATRAALLDGFSAWTPPSGVHASVADVKLLLTWRYSYGDGILDLWTRAAVEEFLLEFCPRHLVAEGPEIDALPAAPAAWVEFLADEGMLAAGGDPPERIRELCDAILPRFRAAMAEPPADPATARATVGPVRMPRPDAIAETVRAGQALVTARSLATFCAAPGRKLTAKGNLRVADARELVKVLQTGDDPEQGGYGPVRSADRLRGVSTWFDIGLAAGAVRRLNGRVVAVARFAKLDDVAAHDAVVRAVLDEPPATGDVLARCERDATVFLLAKLLNGPVEGLEALALIEHVLADRIRMDRDDIRPLVGRTFERVADVLDGLDLVTVEMSRCSECPDEHPLFELTPAGIPHAVERARAAGVEVVVLPDPVESSAAELAAGITASGPDFGTDVRAWLAIQPDLDVAVDELAAAVVAADRAPAEVMVALGVLEDLPVPGVPEAVHRHGAEVHEGLLMPWLVEHGQLDGSTIADALVLRSVVDVAAALIDLGVDDEAVDTFPAPASISLLRDLWRTDHPRLVEVLELVGREHPDKAVAKEARRSLMKLRNRAAQ